MSKAALEDFEAIFVALRFGTSHNNDHALNKWDKNMKKVIDTY